MKLPKSRLFWAVSLSHFTNDLFMSMGPVLLTFISGVYMPITSAQIGLAQSMREFVGALGQPIMGWVGDRGGARWIGTLGLAWTVIGTLLGQYFATLRNYPLMVIFFGPQCHRERGYPPDWGLVCHLQRNRIRQPQHEFLLLDGAAWLGTGTGDRWCSAGHDPSRWTIGQL
ncbi:MAG UNVERIFIED_CONTAM: hypothetical protein LVT10_13280 [Anaerolineae bacterium]|jgi:MFS family permease